MLVSCKRTSLSTHHVVARNVRGEHKHHHRKERENHVPHSRLPHNLARREDRFRLQQDRARVGPIHFGETELCELHVAQVVRRRIRHRECDAADLHRDQRELVCFKRVGIRLGDDPGNSAVRVLRHQARLVDQRRILRVEE